MFQLKKQSSGTLVDRLCQVLDQEAVRYCQWKGHFKEKRWASGEGDIDLLVDRIDGDRFGNILGRLGFKQALPPAERQIPGTSHYFGFDPNINKFIHLHVHHQIVFGHHATMNYHLPVERPLLESCRPGKFFRTPAPEMELVLFVINTIARYSVFASILRKQPGWSLTAEQNLEYLKSKADAAKTSELLEKFVPMIAPAFFDTCLRSLQRQCSPWIQLKIKWQLHRRLKAHIRRTQSMDFLCCLKYWGLNRIQGVMRGRPTRNQLSSGGKLIALVGGDGAGKSTAVSGLNDWLSRSFCTTTIHLGKPSKSGCTIMVAIARRVALHFGTLFDLVRPVSTTNVHRLRFRDLLLLLRSVCIARDRYLLYKRARRLATNGSIVICDRYPTPHIESMDGPNIGRLTRGSRTRITAFLQKTEAYYYRHIMPADTMIVLKVRPEIAVQRKTDEDSDYVHARSLEVWKLDLSKTAHVLDAGRAKADVLSDLKSIVWSEL